MVTKFYNELKDDILKPYYELIKGFPAELRAKLFEPFQRGKAPRFDSVQGSGLGLSIVSDCARLLGGMAEIVDVNYADVCIRVRLPMVEEQV